MVGEVFVEVVREGVEELAEHGELAPARPGPLSDLGTGKSGVRRRCEVELEAELVGE